MSITRFINLHTVTGALLLIGSCALAGITFLVTEYEPGISAEAITQTVQEELTDQELYMRLANGYAEWIQYNESAVQVNGLIATGTIILVIDAIALLTAGAVIGAFDLSGSVHSKGLFGLLVVFLGFLSFVIYKFDLWIHTHNAITS